MSTGGLILYCLVFVAIMAVVTIIPSRKQKKQVEALMNKMAVGDYCVTHGGMYGKIIDMTNDMVIVEFGGKNCRIPMVKTAIASIEKADAAQSGKISENAKRATGEGTEIQ